MSLHRNALIRPSLRPSKASGVGRSARGDQKYTAAKTESLHFNYNLADGLTAGQMVVGLPDFGQRERLVVQQGFQSA